MNAWKTFWSKPHPGFIKLRNRAAICSAAGVALLTLVQSLEALGADFPAWISQAIGMFTFGCGIITFVCQCTSAPPDNNSL